jgi:hypothetical protein
MGPTNLFRPERRHRAEPLIVLVTTTGGNVGCAGLSVASR